MLNQLMSDIIQYGKAVTDNSVQLHFQPILDQLGQHFAIPVVSLLVGQAFYSLLRTGNGWRIQLVAVRHRLEALHQLRDFIRIGYDHLVSRVLA